MQRLLVRTGFILLLAACASRGSSVTVDLPTAGGVGPGASVRFRGADIGHVESVTPTRDGVRLQLLIDRPDAPVRLADRVAVRPDGIFGDYAVDIVPGPDTAAPIGRRASLRAATPDSLASIREAIIRATAQEFIDQFRRADSNRAPTAARPSSRP